MIFDTSAANGFNDEVSRCGEELVLMTRLKLVQMKYFHTALDDGPTRV
jgi:hypothetical protein